MTDEGIQQNPSVAPAGPLDAHTAALTAGADAAYDRRDQAWFNALPTEDLVTLWGLVSGENLFSSLGGPWDDEVFDALYPRGYFKDITE